MNDIEMIPLAKLRLSEANVRKNDSNLFIEELAANIEAKGLLQNLIVVPAKKRGMFDVTAGGRRLLVTHGDLFDGVIQCARWLAVVGDALYTFTLRLNQHLNAFRARLGLRYWSLSQFLKHKVKNAVSYLSLIHISEPTRPY